jgi:hypothetical protein
MPRRSGSNHPVTYIPFFLDVREFRQPTIEVDAPLFPRPRSQSFNPASANDKLSISDIPAAISQVSCAPTLSASISLLGSGLGGAKYHQQDR